TVKVHGVFPSSCGYVASSQQLQFHRVARGDSDPVVTPFMQVGTYPTRNFATLGPSTLLLNLLCLEAGPSHFCSALHVAMQVGLYHPRKHFCLRGLAYSL